jgi:hypothetical protein
MKTGTLTCVATLLLLAGPRAGAQTTTDARAATLLDQARAAIGGTAAANRVRAFEATGTVKRAAGNMQLAGDLTIQVELPDRMLRTDSLSPDGGLTLVTEQGLNGDRLLRSTRTFNAPPGAVIRTPPPPERGSDAETQARRAARADLARLLVVMLLRDTSSFPIEVSNGGTAESPDGTADVLTFTGRDDSTFTAQLLLDTTTHRPLMLVYRGVAPRMVVRTERRPQTSADGPLPALPAGDVVDIQMFLDDYRQVDGLMLPHHVSRSVAGEVTEEWTFSSFALNPSFKDGTFDAR